MLYDMLHRGHSVRAEREAATFGAVKRTIERDIECLREVLGFQLERTDQPGVGVVYKLPHERGRWEVTLWQVLAVVVGVPSADVLAFS